MATTETTIDEKQLRQLTLFEGSRYPSLDVKLTGGVTGDAGMLLPVATSLRIGEAFELVVRGVVVAKKHALSFDKDGEEIRTLVVTLKVDDVQEDAA